MLCVIDGAKALSRAIREVLGAHTPVQRCVRHKERNALDHLPERDRPPVKRRCNRHGRSTTTPQRVERLRALAAESTVAIRAPRRRLREGLDEDAHRHSSRRARRAAQDAGVHQFVRVDDRNGPPHQPQRQALAERRNVPALDAAGCSKPSSSSGAGLLPEAARGRRPATSPVRPSPTRQRPRSPRPEFETIHSGNRRRRFHGDRDISSLKKKATFLWSLGPRPRLGLVSGSYLLARMNASVEVLTREGHADWSPSSGPRRI